MWPTMCEPSKSTTRVRIPTPGLTDGSMPTDPPLK
jgi:hypothetical protein